MSDEPEGWHGRSLCPLCGDFPSSGGLLVDGDERSVLYKDSSGHEWRVSWTVSHV